MALTFVSRKYVCLVCGHSGKAYSVISKLADIESYFPIDSRPAELHSTYLYKEIVERDIDDLPAKRYVVSYPCDNCKSTDILAEKQENYSNVLNFYGQSEAGKWFEGFAKHD